MARELKGEKLEKELLRLEEMKAYEKENAQYELICGIDEAGRGPLAGPVAAGAVILPKDCQILYLNDSKKLSEKRREELFLEIKEKALAWSVGIATPQRIDEINILQATYEAMREAIKGLGVQPGLLLNDARDLNSSDPYCKRRRKKCIYCSSQHFSQSYQGPYDDGI